MFQILLALHAGEFHQLEASLLDAANAESNLPRLRIHLGVRDRRLTANVLGVQRRVALDDMDGVAVEIPDMSDQVRSFWLATSTLGVAFPMASGIAFKQLDLRLGMRASTQIEARTIVFMAVLSPRCGGFGHANGFQFRDNLGPPLFEPRRNVKLGA